MIVINLELLVCGFIVWFGTIAGCVLSFYLGVKSQQPVATEIPSLPEEELSITSEDEELAHFQIN